MGRIRLISLLILVIALLFIGRLYFLQVVDNQIYLDKGNRQYSQSAGGIFDRGTIYFTDKTGNQVAAATLQSGFTVAINPEILKNPETVYTQINAIMSAHGDAPLDHDTFIAKATKTGDPYEEIATHVDQSTGDALNNLNITGLSVYQERWRFYPAGTLAANTVGFMAYQGNTYAGRYGLESQYDTTLTRNDNAYVNFFAQIFSNIKQTQADLEEGDVVTSIEPTVQNFLQTELQKVQTEYRSELTGGIIINPKTGTIYAMGVVPSFDLNDTKDVADVSLFENPLVENVYEMGSIIKPLTVSAGIDLGMITASSTYIDTGCITVDGKSLCNFDRLYRGTTDIQTALGQSLNVGMAHIVSVIGDDNFDKYFYGFGIGQRTNIDLPNEALDIVTNLQTSRQLEHMDAAFGQGIALTPVATVRALSAVANGGVLITPHVATQIDYTDGLTKTLSYPAQNRVIKQSTSQEVTRMMVYDVDNILSQGKDKMPDYSIAAKTGTAQIAEAGGYSATDFLHSFVGYFPAYDPQFLIFLYTVKPQGVQYSSESLTNPFFDVVHFLINYYEVPPDR
jgi:stage V sporulation protein D (sporulation-specific penicillin-binding protein)